MAGAETKHELLTILGGLASRVIEDKEFVRSLLSEIRAMGDNYFFDLIRDEGHQLGLVEGRKEGLEKGLEQGIERGQTQEARRALLRVLGSRFGNIPLNVRERVEKTAILARLEDLIDHAARSPDLEVFVQCLEAR